MQFFDYDGAKLTGVNLPGKKGIPIYIGAQGPKVLDLAGRVGDGALINASNPKDFAIAIPIIKAACDKVGKKNFDIGAYTAMSIDQSEKKARNAAKIVAAFIAAGSPPDLLTRHGLDLNNVAKIKAALGKFDFKTVGELVGDKEIDAFTIAGTPEMVKQKCEALTKAGVTQIIFGSPLGPGHDQLDPPARQIRRISADPIPAGVQPQNGMATLADILLFFIFPSIPGYPLPDLRANDYEVVPEIVRLSRHVFGQGSCHQQGHAAVSHRTPHRAQVQDQSGPVKTADRPVIIPSVKRRWLPVLPRCSDDRDAHLSRWQPDHPW